MFPKPLFFEYRTLFLDRQQCSFLIPEEPLECICPEGAVSTEYSVGKNPPKCRNKKKAKIGQGVRATHLAVASPPQKMAAFLKLCN
jgi:hypothetical protein